MSIRMLGSGTKIFFTMSRVMPSIFLGKLSFPEFASSMILFAGGTRPPGLEHSSLDSLAL